MQGIMTDVKEKRPRAVKKTVHEIENVRKISETNMLTVSEYAEILGMSLDGARQLLINHNIPYRNKNDDNNTLCLSCQNNSCSWSKAFKPVEGWEAIPTKIMRKGQIDAESYLVKTCPEFIGRDLIYQKFRETLGKIFYEIDKSRHLSTILYINKKLLKSLTDHMDVKDLEKLMNLKIIVGTEKTFRLEQENDR